MIAGLIAISIMGAKVVKELPKQTVTLIAPDLTPPQLPMTKKSATTSGGGGGGGDHDKLQAPKGKLPKSCDGTDHAPGDGHSQRQS